VVSFSISIRREKKMQKSLLEFVEKKEKQVDEMLYYSNWYNAFYNACMNNGIDPEELIKKSIHKSRRKNEGRKRNA